MGDGELWVQTKPSIRCEIREAENIRRCARSWGGLWTRNERRYLSVTAEFEEIMATAVADSDERSRRSGVFSGLRKGGERGRRGRALYRRGVAMKWARIQGH
jgi:hypothetical protein